MANKSDEVRKLTNPLYKMENKLTWKKVLNAIVQAAIAALTALGITSCITL